MAVADYVTKTDLDANLELVHDYVDTAVDTLTVEMDRQFKEVRSEMDRQFKGVDLQFEGVNSKLDKILTHLGIK